MPGPTFSPWASSCGSPSARGGCSCGRSRSTPSSPYAKSRCRPSQNLLHTCRNSSRPSSSKPCGKLPRSDTRARHRCASPSKATSTRRRPPTPKGCQAFSQPISRTSTKLHWPRSRPSLSMTKQTTCGTSTSMTHRLSMKLRPAWSRQTLSWSTATPWWTSRPKWRRRSGSSRPQNQWS